MIDERRHYRLSLPCAVLDGADVVHLVSGEDFRFTLRAPGLEQWAPGFIAQLDGRVALGALIATLPAPARAQAKRLSEQLASERLLVEATPLERPESVRGTPRVHGEGSLARSVERRLGSGAAAGDRIVHVFCAETLDERRALEFNQQRLADGEPWLWLSTGALARAYVGPLFLPWRGPCFGCLVAAFDRLSPAPEIRDALRAHSQQDRSLPRAELPAPAVEVVAELAAWKLDAREWLEVPPAVYRLHVFELSSFEISSEAVPVDADCPVRCRTLRRP